MAGKSGKIVGFLFFAPLVLAVAFAMFLVVVDFTIPSDYTVKEIVKVLGPEFLYYPDRIRVNFGV